APGPLFRASITTTAANCTTQQGVFNAATNVCSFPGRAAPAGAQGFPGIPTASATDESRHSYAAYVELDTNIFEGFTTVLAGRFEHFSDFGSTLTGKLAMRYEPIRGYAVRGSISNGFRAPSLHQQFFTTTSTNFINGLPVDISTLAVNSPVARALGSRDLEPEESVNLSIGATANPLPGLTFTVDYYHNRTSIQRRINDLGPLATIPGIVLFGRVEGIRFTDGQPRDKIVFSAEGELGNFGLTARTTRYGRVISPGATAPLADPNS